jgi:hypothetical protein
MKLEKSTFAGSGPALIAGVHYAAAFPMQGISFFN